LATPLSAVSSCTPNFVPLAPLYLVPPFDVPVDGGQPLVL